MALLIVAIEFKVYIMITYRYDSEGNYVMLRNRKAIKRVCPQVCGPPVIWIGRS